MKKVSIIMGIYNCADTLEDAVSCIQNQTYPNWELILCDDGSTDSTYEIARKLQEKDPERILLLKNDRNCGLNHTLNRCLEAASGEYIARMDGDDLCSPERLQTEVEALDAHPEISIVSTNMEFFDESGVWGKIAHPEYPQSRDFLKGSPFCHAPCMVRKEAFDAAGGYTEDKKLLRVEDYHLWLKMYKAGFRGMNIGQVLYSMRDDRNAYRRRKFRYRINEAYVRLLVVRELKLPVWGYLLAARPILVGLLPAGIYDVLHKARLRK